MVPDQDRNFVILEIRVSIPAAGTQGRKGKKSKHLFSIIRIILLQNTTRKALSWSTDSSDCVKQVLAAVQVGGGGGERERENTVT